VRVGSGHLSNSQHRNQYQDIMIVIIIVMLVLVKLEETSREESTQRMVAELEDRTSLCDGN
jgi:hypothetical protein